MNYLTLEGLPPYDGRYELPTPDEFNTREAGWVKRYSGYVLADFDGVSKAAGDAEFLSVWTIITLQRAQKITKEEVPRMWEYLLDYRIFEHITIEAEEEEEQLPPSSETNSNGSPVSSGLVSEPSSVISGPSLPPTGAPDSGSSGSVPPTSGT